MVPPPPHTRKDPTTVDLTDVHLEVATAAYLASLVGGGIIVKPDAFCEAHWLAERGWLERRFVDGKMGWYWSPRAEVALDVTGLMQLGADPLDERGS